MDILSMHHKFLKWIVFVDKINGLCLRTLTSWSESWRNWPFILWGLFCFCYPGLFSTWFNVWFLNCPVRLVLRLASLLDFRWLPLDVYFPQMFFFTIFLSRAEIWFLLCFLASNLVLILMILHVFCVRVYVSSSSEE